MDIIGLWILWMALSIIVAESRYAAFPSRFFKSDTPVLGVVNDFNHGECFTGIAGLGAWLNGRSIAPTTTTLPNKAVLATGFPVNRDFESESISEFIGRIVRFKKIRLLGSAALSLAYTACGRIDAYTEEDIMLWDVAAGIAIMAAAGGFVSHSESNKKTWARTVYAGEVFRNLDALNQAGPIRLFFAQMLLEKCLSRKVVGLRILPSR